MTSIASCLATVIRHGRLQNTYLAALDEARVSERFLQTVLSSSPDCVKVLDKDGRVLFINEPGLSALRVRASDVLNRNWLQFWKGRNRELAGAALKQAAEKGEGRFQGSRPTFRNEPRSWDVIIARLPEDKFSGGKFVVISRDITERVLSEEKLAQANQKLILHAATLEESVANRTRDLRRANDRMKSLARKLVRSQEDERSSIARELHDEIGQKLTALKLLLEETRMRPANGAVNKAIDTVAGLQKEVQTLSFALKQAIPDHISLVTALRWHFRQLEQTGRLVVSFKHQRLSPELGQELTHAAFRIIQEALTNVIRHANTKKAAVLLISNTKRLLLRVSDRGIGFDPGQYQGTSSGLSGMEERVLLLGGEFSIDSKSSSGTVISALIPISTGIDGKSHETDVAA